MKKKTREDSKKALKVSQQSLKTFLQTRKSRYEEGETVPTRSKKNDVLTYLSEQNARESRLKEKKL